MTAHLASLIVYYFSASRRREASAASGIQFRHLLKALKSRGHLPSLRLGIWQSAVRWLITYPVTSNLMFRLLFPILKKFLLKIFLRLELTVKTESENIWIC